MNSSPLLLVPACEKGLGGGHLNRSVFLLNKLKEAGREAFLWISESCKEDVLRRFEELKIDDSRVLSRPEELSTHSWIIILDRFRTEPEELDFWSNFGPVIGIDEGGTWRNRFDFLIDLLPGLDRAEPNLNAPWLLPLPKNRRPAGGNREEAGVPLRILISFGAEDSAGLGPLAARSLLAQKLQGEEITLVAANYKKIDKAELPGVTVIGKYPDLKERLAGYDLFITHFGLGAFEAVYARVPVLLLSPTAYHEKLGRNAGFLLSAPGAKLRNDVKRLFSTDDGKLQLKNRGEEIRRCFCLEDDQKEDIGSFINRLAPGSPRSCPVCEKVALPPALARFSDETYRSCPQCGAIYLSRLNEPPIEYGKEYFFEQYKKQYGKTYLEDFPNLKEMGRKRLVHIREQLNYSKEHHPEAQRRIDFQIKSAEEKPALLDIGCAYGPFLAAAAECGFAPQGIDPAEDAIRYINEELGFPAWQGFFPDGLKSQVLPQNNEAGLFDVVSLWYVIEHFREPGKMLAEIHRLLKDRGVVAFSTPSFSGISGRKSLRAFLENSPPDHWTIWSPGTCRKIFRQYGFKLRKIVVTGHHPERFPLLGRFAKPAGKETGTSASLLYRLLLFASRLFRLGDTFEAYGVKL